MSPYREQVAAVLRAVSIRGDMRYAWLGRASRPLPEAVQAELDEAERRSYLVACLREELYCSFYCHGSPVPARWGEPQAVAADPWLLGALSDANHGRDGWEDGWTVDRLDGGETVVTGARLRTRVATADCRALDGRLLERHARERPASRPGTHFTARRRPGPVPPEGRRSPVTSRSLRRCRPVRAARGVRLASHGAA